MTPAPAARPAAAGATTATEPEGKGLRVRDAADRRRERISAEPSPPEQAQNVGAALPGAQHLPQHGEKRFGFKRGAAKQTKRTAPCPRAARARSVPVAGIDSLRATLGNCLGHTRRSGFGPGRRHAEMDFQEDQQRGVLPTESNTPNHCWSSNGELTRTRSFGALSQRARPHSPDHLHSFSLLLFQPEFLSPEHRFLG